MNREGWADEYTLIAEILFFFHFKRCICIIHAPTTEYDIKGDFKSIFKHTLSHSSDFSFQNFHFPEGKLLLIV